MHPLLSEQHHAQREWYARGGKCMHTYIGVTTDHARREMFARILDGVARREMYACIVVEAALCLEGNFCINGARRLIK